MRDAESRFADATRVAGIGIVSTVAAAILAIGVAPASAEYIHGPVSAEFGPSGTSGTSFAGINTLAYQQATKRLYVLAENAINGFSNPSAGTFTPLGGNFPIGVTSSGGDSDIAVDNSAGASAGHLFWTPDGAEIRGYTASGSALGGFPITPPAETCGIAIDNAGDIWGGSYGSESVNEWGPGGGSVIQSFSTAASVGRACKIGVDPSNNDVYPSGYGESKIAKYTAASGYTSFTQLGGAGGVGVSNNRIAFNASKHKVYVGSNNGSTIRAYGTETGELVETFDITGGGVSGLAVQESTDTVFVANSNGFVQELKGILVPKVTTGEPTANSTVSGTADPDGAGEITECFFEYGLEGPSGTTPYGSKINCTPGGGINAVTQVEAGLPSLLGEETYHYRLVLKNANGTVKGFDKTITPHNVKGLKTEAASEVLRTTATLNGSFEGTNEPTTYYFEYGTTSGYGNRMPASPTEVSAGTTTGHTTMSQPISGLTPDTTYHFRVVGKNPIGVSPGKDETFKTPLAVQGVMTEGADAITRTTAVLHGSFTGNGEAHTFSFEWGPTAAYGHVSPGGSAGSGTGKVSVQELVEGFEVQLPTSHPYHYRLVATNSTGSSYGPDRTFSTLPPLEPTVGDESAEEVTPTGAKLNAVVNPGEGETVFEFQYGAESTYGFATPVSESVGNDLADHPVSSTLSGLTPGTTYHYRVIAYNFAGTAAGIDRTFTTPDVPTVVLSSSVSVARTSAQLTATVGANSSPTSVHFEYGPSAGYGSSTAPVSIGTPLVAAPVSSDLTNLSPGTTYHYKVVATNAIGTTNGPDQTFTTAPEVTKPTERPKPCKKGTVRKHGKCVKKKQHRKNHRHTGRNG